MEQFVPYLSGATSIPLIPSSKATTLIPMNPKTSYVVGETLPGSTKRTTLNDLWVFNPASAGL